MNKCILVGNASNVLGKKLGSYINSFENVVRFIIILQHEFTNLQAKP